MPHALDEAIRLTPTGDNTYAGSTHPAYANMVGPFGGATCAVLLNGALIHPARLGDPIAQTVNFAGPITDGPFSVEAVPVRTNRSTQHWNLLLTQDGAVCASGSAVFAKRRETWSVQEATPPANMPPATTLPRTDIGNLTAWVRCFDMRFLPGEEPLWLDEQEQSHSATKLWVRDDPPRPLDFASLASICDVFFPRIFDRRRKRAPIGTVTISSYFHADADLLAAQGERHVLATARGLSFRNGYFDQSASIWGDDGQLLASTHQMVYYRE